MKDAAAGRPDRSEARVRGPLLLTMGDAGGIGPEIIARAFLAGRLQRVVVIGSPAVMRRALGWLGVARPVAVLEQPGDVTNVPPHALPMLVPGGLPEDLMDAPVGHVDARFGAAAARCIESAVDWLVPGPGGPANAAGLVTAPIHKEALSAAAVAYPGHTEMLQALAAQHAPGRVVAPVRMMLANDELRVVLVTIHVALRRALDLIDQDRVLETVRMTHRAGLAFGLPMPRIAVAGLNPHAGEGGLFGIEEVQVIAPAIAQARLEGIDATGPYAPDTVFMRSRHAAGHPGEFDFVVAMTHDHGLIPVKYLGVERGVNVTLGLPFVRTSPDHGTAFDIVGTRRADASSLVAAVDMAWRLAGSRPAP
jgi:4-hydroxythreonine-4-phosphate dehydrogenase